MNEQIGWMTVSSVRHTVSGITWTSPTYMYLERVSQEWHDGQNDKRGIFLDFYQEDTLLDNWQRGCIFNAEQELKWSWQGDGFHAVCCGLHLPEGFNEIRLDAPVVQERTYFLWGTPIQKGARDTLGLQKSQGTYYVELQIPRIMHYPFQGQGEQGRMKVQIREYYESTGQLAYYRWIGLE